MAALLKILFISWLWFFAALCYDKLIWFWGHECIPDLQAIRLIGAPQDLNT